MLDYDRRYSSKPVRYPVAGIPQAWAAAAMPNMLTSLLGLRPDGFAPGLDICQPRLPDWLDWVMVRRLRVGGREVDLRFDRAEDATLVAVTRNPADRKVAVHS